MLPLHHRAVFGGELIYGSPPKSKEDEQARTYGNPGGAAYGSRTRANSLEGCDASSTPMLHMAEAAGFEPANRRVKVCCLYRLTTLLYDGRAVSFHKPQEPPFLRDSGSAPACQSILPDRANKHRAIFDRISICCNRYSALPVGMVETNGLEPLT